MSGHTLLLGGAERAHAGARSLRLRSLAIPDARSWVALLSRMIAGLAVAMRDLVPAHVLGGRP